MNRLPKVLQNEIWEYVHGDRTYWKTQFTNVIEELEQLIEHVEDCTYDRKVPLTSKTIMLVLCASEGISDQNEGLQWRRFLSRHNHPMYCDSVADYKIHVHAFSEFRS